MSKLLESWRAAAGKPFGKWLFSKSVASRVPYTGTIGARIEELEPRRSRVTLRDRRRVRNHLDSIHAVALMNLGELASGLALLAALDDDRRAILVKFETSFVKKARGTLTATGRVDESVDLRADGEFTVSADLEDEAGDRVAAVTATWRVSA